MQRCLIIVGRIFLVHGDDFAFCGGQEELTWDTEKMKSCFEIKVRAALGREAGDDKHAVILGRHARWTERGIEYEADPKHRKLIMDHLGFGKDSSYLVLNEEKDWRKVEVWEEEFLEPDDATVFLE